MGKMIVAVIALMLAAVPLAAQAAEADKEKAQVTEADLKKGEKVFKRKCRQCHNADKEKKKIGPHLVGLFGRKAGTVDGFRYSSAMKAKGEEGLVWDAETLDEYLTRPKKMVPKGKMMFPGLKKEADRFNLIGYLEKVTKKPAE